MPPHFAAHFMRVICHAPRLLQANIFRERHAAADFDAHAPMLFYYAFRERTRDARKIMLCRAEHDARAFVFRRAIDTVIIRACLSAASVVRLLTPDA